MFKRILCLLLCITLISGCFYGCGEIKGADETVIFPIDHDPKFLDPQIISFSGSKNIIANCFEGLVTLDEKGEIAPGVAQSWETSISGLEYTFHLRKDAKWKVSSSSGALIGENYKETFDTSVTAHDFVFALRRALKPETKSPYASLLFAIKNASAVNSGKKKASALGVKALDKYTLKITLSRTDPDFLYTLLEAVCMPCNEEFFEATRGRYGLSVKYLIYNGPFYINNWADNASVTLRRNPDYYDVAKVMPRSLYFSINDEQDTRLKKLRDEVYNITPLNSEQAKEISQKKKYALAAFDNSVLSFLFNCEDTALSNVNIRRAIASGVDREVLNSHLGAPDAKGIIPSSQKIGGISYRESVGKISPYENSSPLALFEKGLDEIGENDIEITVICEEKHEVAVRNIMQGWQSVLGIGFNVFVEAMSEDELTARVEKGEYQLAFCNLTFNSNTSYPALQSFTSDSENNLARYRNKKYDSLVKKIKLSSGIAANVNASKKAEEHLIENAVAVPLYESKSYYGFESGVSGAIFSLSGEIIYMKNILIP